MIQQPSKVFVVGNERRCPRCDRPVDCGPRRVVQDHPSSAGSCSRACCNRSFFPNSQKHERRAVFGESKVAKGRAWPTVSNQPATKSAQTTVKKRWGARRHGDMSFGARRSLQ